MTIDNLQQPSGESLRAIYELNVLTTEDFPFSVDMTCTGCEVNHDNKCLFAWDGYNTDGDCLAAK